MKLAIGKVSAVLFCLVSSSAEAAQWGYFSSKDEMTGKRQAYATGSESSPTRPMGFPYANVKGWLGFGCDNHDEWAFVGFSEAPNLTNTKPQSGGYSTFSTRIRWDDNVENVQMSQKWGAKFLHFKNDASAITKMINARTVLFELSWYGASKVYFKFTLDGSTSAIMKARADCGKEVGKREKARLKKIEAMEKAANKAFEEAMAAPIEEAKAKANRSQTAMTATTQDSKYNPTQLLSISEVDAVRQQIRKCWNLPAGAKDAKNLIIELRMTMNPDGTVRQARILDQKRLESDPFFRATAESAIRATLNPLCNPLNLPSEKYQQWQTLVLILDPHQMF